MTSPHQVDNVVLVTGPAGAGRTTAINAFEDMGFEAIHNMPLSLVPRFIRGQAIEGNLVLGMDARTRDFDVKSVLDIAEMISGYENYSCSLVYLDCSEEVLLRRYSETRRRHPLSPDETPEKGIKVEKDLLQILRSRADVLIDTSELSPHDLKAEISSMFGQQADDFLAVNIQSFSYKRGVPRGIDMVLDCRFLNNPYWDESLRAKSGLDEEVRDYVRNDDRYLEFLDRIVDLLSSLLPSYREEGKAHFTLGLGCTGGQHRSVTAAEDLSLAIGRLGWQVALRHRELERRQRLEQSERTT